MSWGNFMKKIYNMGIDVGYTTVKTVILYDDIPIYKEYRRHFSDVRNINKSIKGYIMNIEEFSHIGIFSKNPVDLGSRCTVFMNSKVKQAQKEGATLADISSGLSYSVIKNALFKVIKIRDFTKLCNSIVVQGGTFYNDLVVRAFEKLTNRDVIRPSISGLMGGFGCVLIAKDKFKENYKSKILNLNELDNIKLETTGSRCSECSNKCLLTINKFDKEGIFISGNRCEKGAFLNGDSSIQNHEKGIDSIVSETVCYPAKMVHGHIQSLINRGIKTIFYPSVTHEYKEDKSTDNNYNCPVVISYSELIKNN